MINGKILVHFRAPILSLSGYGTHARQIMDYLLSDSRLEVVVEAINWGHCPYIHNHPKLKTYYEAIYKFQQVKDKVPFDISLQLTIPNEFKRCAQLNIGITAGIEVDRCTKIWIEKCNEMDIVVVPSNFSKQVLESTIYALKHPDGKITELKLNKKIVVIPEWFEKPETIEPLDLKFETNTNLLFVGQWGNKGGFGEDRKNIADLIKVFLETFKDNSRVGLILKVNIIGNSQEDLFHVKERINQIKENFKNVKCKLYLLHDTLTDSEMWGLYTHPQVSGFISLTHGEGFGLPLLEASAAGLPVIATNWSGHVDFLREKNGFLPVECGLVDIPKCQVWDGVIDEGSRWARFIEDSAKKRMKKFLESPKSIQKQAVENIVWLNENFSKESILKKWKEFFDGFISQETDTPQTESNPQLLQRNNLIQNLKELVKESDKEKVLFILPRSIGDIVMSTAVVDSLLTHRHFDSDFYFATSVEYSEILQQLQTKYSNLNIIQFKEEMMNSELTSNVWDVVYNPGVNIQYNFSNWLLGNGQYAVRLFEEFAKQCNLFPKEITNYVLPFTECTIPDGPYITITPAASRDTKSYKHWQDVIDNLREMLPNVVIAQTGFATEKLYDNVEDFRGKTLPETFFLIKNAILHLSPDTATAHIAAAVETPHIVMFGSTTQACSPVVLGKKTLQVFMESTNRHGCKNACYKEVCFNKVEGKNCLSEIEPQTICQTVKMLIEKLQEEENESKQIVTSPSESAMEI